MIQNINNLIKFYQDECYVIYKPFESEYMINNVTEIEQEVIR